MQDMGTIATDDSVAYSYGSQSVCISYRARILAWKMAVRIEVLFGLETPGDGSQLVPKSTQPPSRFLGLRLGLELVLVLGLG